MAMKYTAAMIRMITIRPIHTITMIKSLSVSAILLFVPSSAMTVVGLELGRMSGKQKQRQFTKGKNKREGWAEKR